MFKTNMRRFDSMKIITKKAWKGAHVTVLETEEILNTYIPQHLRITAACCLGSQWDTRVWCCTGFRTQGGARSIVSSR